MERAGKAADFGRGAEISGGMMPYLNGSKFLT